MKYPSTRFLLLAAATVIGLACPARAAFVTVDDFSDLVLWAGTGENEAGFVLQFSASQSPTAIAWGYRWSEVATMQEMMNAITGTTVLVNGDSVPPGLDARLSIDGTQYSFGVLLNSITYEQSGLPAGWSQTTRQIVNTYFDDGNFPVLYTRANAGGEWVTEPESTTMLFSYSEVGASDITLTPGGWYGFVQGTGAETFSFAQPVAAVPEPGTWALAASAAAATAAAAWRRARRRRLVTRGAARATRVPRA